MNESQQGATASFPGRIIARLLNITERRLQQLAREGIIPKSERGVYPLAASVRGYVTYLQNVGVNAEGVADPEKLEPFKRRAYYQGELDKLNLARQRGDLIEAMDCEQQFAAVFKIVAEFFDTMPDVLERDCGLTAAQVLKVEKRLDQAREDLYLAINKPINAGRPAKKSK